MNNQTTIEAPPTLSEPAAQKKSGPALLMCWPPSSATKSDYLPVTGEVIVGRHKNSDICINDELASKSHFKLTATQDGFVLSDLNSRNGTYLGGHKVVEPISIDDQAIIRVGRTLLVFDRFGRASADLPLPPNFGMVGRFFTKPILQSLVEASHSSRHILLSGESGTGKELAAKALADLMGTSGSPLLLVAHNAAHFASEEEASVSLFGVTAKVFSGVDARVGLIETAHGGMLFIDEAHCLPERLQKSLLRVIEDGQLSRIGETRHQQAEVNFVLASNVENPTMGLASDLFARLRAVRIPSLRDRIADLPSIFAHAVKAAMVGRHINPEPVLSALKATHLEKMCLHGFQTQNVRGLLDVADRLATKMVVGVPAADAVFEVFAELFEADRDKAPEPSSPPVSPSGNAAEDSEEPASYTGRSHYERNKDIMIAAIKESGGNISAAVKALKTKGIPCSWRWLSEYAKKWDEG